MKKSLKFFLVFFIITLLLFSCQKNNPTGSSEININTETTIPTLKDENTSETFLLEYVQVEGILYWYDSLTQTEISQGISYHVYREVLNQNKFKRIAITDNNRYPVKFIDKSTPHHYIILKGVDKEYANSYSNIISVPQTNSTKGSEEDDDSGGKKTIDDYLPYESQ